MEHFQRSISDQFFGNFGSWSCCCNFTSCIWVWPYWETHIQFLLASAQPHQLDLQRSADGSGASMKPMNQPSGWEVCNIDVIKKINSVPFYFFYCIHLQQEFSFQKTTQLLKLVSFPENFERYNCALQQSKRHGQHKWTDIQEAFQSLY